MLTELENKTLKSLNTKFINIKEEDTLKPNRDEFQLNMVELHRKYCNPSNVDKLFEIQKDVKDIEIDMKKNVKNMVSNIENASVNFIFFLNILIVIRR
jgi:hypothetical protein